MINLYSIDAKSFKLEDSVLPRIFEVKAMPLGQDSIIVLRNIKTGYIIYLDILDNIFINGYSVTFEELRKFVYNFSCNCDTDGSVSVFKIFDYTFDCTFE